jgi:hypothetical protein
MEAALVAVVGPLVDGRLFPDTAPPDTARPYAVYQQVGGQVINPVDGTDPGLKGARVQLVVWHHTRLQASALMHAIEAALRQPPINARPPGALVARYDETAQLRGAMQDFEFWFT